MSSESKGAEDFFVMGVEDLYVLQFESGYLQPMSNASKTAVFYSRDGMKRMLKHNMRGKHYDAEEFAAATVIRVRVAHEQDYDVAEFLAESK
tara:strand:+ start:53 stop:328 length:276 start_codon:yes stop_codon:yes gene_type:complete